MNKKIKVSFDFDGSLGDLPKLQKYAKQLVDKGIEVWIVTGRYENIEDYTPAFCDAYSITDLKKQHEHLFIVAERCGITKNHIQYMNMDDKWKFFNKNEGFLWHIDDDTYEILDINSFTNTKAILTTDMWKQICNKLIKDYNEN